MTDRLAKTLERLSPEQRALLTQRMLRKQQQAEAIPRRSGDAPVPASFGQERLWFLERLEPGNPAYHLVRALWIDGRFDSETLRRSLRLLVRRHEALRTTFRTVDGQPMQVVAPDPRFELRIERIEEETDRDGRAGRIVDEEIQRPFDLEHGPMLRVRLVAFDERRHLLILGLHHIVTDGWSQSILMRELSVLYESSRGLAAGRLRRNDDAAPLPELELQYPDFALWQRRWMNGDRCALQLTYWREQLRGVPALELPADRPRPAIASGVGGFVRLRLPSARVRSLTAADGVSGTTPFMALLAAVAVLLCRLTGRHDFAIGSPIANRRRPELEGLIGLFLNMLALRIDASGDPSYRRLVKRVRETSLDAFSHQDVPFEKLVDELAPERHSSRSPLFQVLFAVQNMEHRLLTFAGAETRPVAGGVMTTRFDLELYAWEQDGGWELWFVYNADLFEPVTVRRLARQYARLLKSVAADPDAPLSRLPLLSPAERHQALVEDSDSARRLPAELRIERLIARRIARAPERIAVAGGDQQVSYGALGARAGQLARRLRRAGAGAGARVGLCVERGPEMVAALLAVLESGAAYVPLDPGLPAERLAYMAGDAGLSALISERRLVDSVPAVAALAAAVGEVLWLDGGEAPAAGSADRRPRVAEADADPDDLAYVIYTSGSTGRPKGVQLSHRNVANFIAAMAREPGLAPADVVLAVTTLSFDIAVLELLLPLAVGARTQVASLEVAADGERLGRLLSRSRATVMQATPATWQLLVQIGWSGAPQLRILCGGEALPARLAAELGRRGRALWNLYGPTETTVWSAATRITAGGDVTLGRPIDNTRLYVLDRRLQPAPLGIPGQLAIAGAGLARGYLRRPALTASSFCPDPFAGRGERLYLTGDLVRRDGAGRLSYFGRLDHQVKLRGFRIELGEIEAALETVPAVERAVVLLGGDGDDLRLVAFLLSVRPEDVPAESEVRDRLGSMLPGYMIPATLVTVGELPLTASGKVDRKALADSEPAAFGPATTLAEAPRGAMEEAVAATFAKVLDRPVDRHASFFALGGHSLLAARLVFRLRRRLGLELPLRAVFDTPTVAGLAARLEAARRGRAVGVPEPDTEAPPIESLPRAGALPLSFAQERLWFLEQLEPNNPAYRLTMAVWIEGPLDAEALRHSLQEVVRRHESLRTTFVADDGVARQVVSEEVGPMLESEHESAGVGSRGRRAQQVVAEEVARSFDLENGPLVKARLVVFDEQRHLFVLCLHHIVTDGWSQGILGRELSELYAAFRRGLPSPLPELEIQYPDFAVWQRRWLSDQVLDRQLAFWRRQLDGVPALDLPADRPRPELPSGAGGVEVVSLPHGLVEGLAAAGGASGTTPFMALLAGLAGLLFRLTSQDDFALGSPVANRRRPELEGLIGLFINVVALRVDLAGDPSYRRLLARVREIALAAFGHQDLPFEKLVDELAPERHLGRSPLFQVLFALQNVARGELELAGTTTRALSRVAVTTRYDLELFAWEGSGGPAAGGPAIGGPAAGWQLAFVYNADLFTGARIRRVARCFVRLLEAALGDPDAPLSQLALLSAAEHHQVVVEETAGAGGMLAALAAGRPVPAQAASAGAPRGPVVAAVEETVPQTPRGPAEEAVATAFGEVLRRPQVGRLESFFALGGHSLLATRAVARIRRALDVELSVRALFEAPTVAGLAAGLLRSRPAPPPIRPRSEQPAAADPRRLPLSFAQERLWFLDRLEPQSTAFNLQTAARWPGAVQAAILEHSLNDLVERHEALRTTFPAVDGAPYQRIAPPSARRLPVIDLSGLPAAARHTEIRRCLRAEADRPFDLVAGPLLRARLLRLAAGAAAEEHLLLVTLHHIVSDEWSNQVLQREVREHYRACLESRPPRLAALPVQYADYALWQRRWLRGEQPEPSLAYWRRQLAGEPPPLDLPFDRPRPRTLSPGGASVRTVLPEPSAEALRAVSQSAAASDFMTLLAAFKVLLMRSTGASDLWLGTPIAGRDHGEVEGLIGFFLNTLVLRSDLSGRPAFSEVLARVRRVALEAYDHQEVPFEKLLEELQPQRDLSRNPLFQVYCNMIQRVRREPDSAEGGEPPAPGFVESPSAFARFDLNLHLVAGADRLAIELSYKKELFDAATIRRMLGWYRTLLESALAAPERPIWALPLLSTAERRQLAGRRQRIRPEGAGAAFPAAAVEQTAPARFEQQVASAPGRVAVRTLERTWTYQQLDRAVNRVAWALQSRLSAPGGERVALLFAPGGSFLEGLWGVLKSGHAYVPLDPSYPPARLRFLLADSQAAAIVTEAAQLELARSLAGDRLEVVAIDRLAETAERPVACPASPSSLAYILYTSGSTGKPKGVMQSHRGLLAHARAYARALSIGPRDRLTLLSSYTFDAAVMDAYGALLTGATLCPLPLRDLAAGELVAAMAELGITIYHSTPSVFRYLFGGSEPAPVRLPRVRLVVLGGEEARREDLEIYRRRFGRRCLLVNGLGPTESTLALQSFIDRESATDRRRVPVGYAVGGARAELLDPGGDAGEVFGEIGLRSDHLALGYWRRPGRTAQAFVPAAGGGRLYRTGDLGRLRADGALEFVGRRDAQVKIRGHRVEPGEVETVLAGHPAVGSTAVVAVADGAGEKRLAAYVVPVSGRAATASELRRYLQRRLPEMLVPSTLQSLETLPLTPNGKLDRAALPAPRAVRGPQQGLAAPRTPFEEQLVGIWQELLAVERIGVDDDFFRLGGHSLLATRLLSRLRSTLGVELPLRALFEAPTVAELAALVEAARRRGQGVELPPIEPAPRDGPLPLSFGQERLWFLEQLEPDSPAYRLTNAVWIDGPLDVRALERSLRQVVRRHESLRTTFSAVDGVPGQAVVEEVGSVLEVADGSVDPEADEPASIREQADEILRDEAARPFDLERGPPMRARLVAFGEGRNLLVLCLHHIVTDGWSQGILARELSVLYAAFRRDPELDSRSLLPELAVQYPDFAVWQRRWLEGRELDRQLGFWRRQLAGVPALELPADRSRPPVASHRGGIERLRLPAALVARLSAAGGGGTTPFMALLAGLAGLLGRLTGQPDFAVGSPVANRRRSELEGLIGLFINLLALRVDLADDPSYRGLLRRAKASALAAFDHQDLPFEKLVDELAPERHLDRSPVFQVLFALQNMGQGSLDLDGTRTRPLAADVTTRFDLELYAWEGPKAPAAGRTPEPGVPAEASWYLALVYNADLFTGTRVRRMARTFSRLLESAAADPDAPLSRLSLVSAAERHQALVEDSDAARRLPAEQLIHRRIARRAAAMPDAVAVVGARRQLTYSALGARAGELARRLRAAGAGTGSRVGLCVERGPEMVAALLAVLESGAAYVPLDPGLPAERLAYMARDAGLAALICERRLAARVPAVAALAETVAGVSLRPTLWLDGDDSAAPDPGRPAVDPAASDLAYVIYTSGSTGRPKGVQLSHRSVVNFLAAMAREPGLGSQDVVLAVTTLSFDISVLELLLPLAVGARAVIATTEVAADGERLARLMSRSRASVMQATPATWLLLVQIGWAGAPDLRMLCGGEALPPRLAVELSRRGGELWNLYGPTETTVWSAATRIAAGDDVTLGRPIDNTRLYVLDRRLRPAPRGIPGQLAIAGAGLARGYLRRPALTAGCFCPDPFAGRGGRLYLTGDLVHRDGAGRLSYLGRLDHQVKLRGFRIELGEIESALEAVPAVERAVVLLGGDGDDRRLAAFLLSARPEDVPAEAAIRDLLASRLPDYMIPASFAVLGELPLTPSGKIDRKALASAGPAPAGPVAGEDPRGPVEEAVAAAFAEVLNRRRVDRHGSFFSLGGHSLLAARLIFRLRESQGLELPLRSVFEAPTVAGLAARLQAARRGAPDAVALADQVPPIESAPRHGPLPLSFGQERLWFLEQLEPGSPAYRLTGATWIEGPLDVRALGRSLQQVVRRHQSLRMTFTAEGGVPRQMVSEEPDPVFEHEHERPTGDRGRRQAALRQRVRAILGEEARRPFDLENGPLMHARLVDFGGRRYLLVLCLHHLVTDGWSQGILARELSMLYAAFCRQLPSPLPELEIQYPDFALWQRRWLEGEVLDRQLAFWRRQLEGVPALDLPADRPRPAVPSGAGGLEVVRLPHRVVAELAAAGGGGGTTPFMVLLAGLAGLLFRLTGQTDFAVGSPVANRRRPELEGLIGLFINVLALRVDLTGDPGYRRLLRRVREASLSAFGHQDLPFERLVDELAPERHLGRSPLFQVLFALQNVEQEPLTLAGTTARPVAPAVTTRYDLELFAREVGGDSAAGGRDGDWLLTFVYNADLFTATRVRHMARGLVRLLEAALDDPGAPLSRLPLLSPAERHQVLVEDPEGADRLLARPAGRPARRRASGARGAAEDDGVAAGFQPPARPLRGGVEEAVAAAFCEVLSRRQVAPHESFFRLGGHSLLAIQLLSRLRSALDVELPLRALFEAPTVAGLAAHLEDARRAGQGIELPPIAAGSRGRRRPLSHAQERLWFLDRMNPGDPTLNLPLALRLRGNLRPAALAAALSEVVRRHQALRTRFLEVDGLPMQEVVPEITLSLPVIDLSALPASRRAREVSRWQDREAAEPFDLTRGPLIRARLLRMAGGDHALFLNLHHIAGDAWSLGVLWAELTALYRAAVTGRASPLAEPPAQYADYAVWQRRWLDGEALTRQTDFWRRRLDGVPALELPADRLRPVVQSYRGCSVRRRLGAALAARLGELGAGRDATLFMVLLAAFKVLLSRWSGQTDVVVGAPIAGRPRSELEGLIGLFLNSLVLRTDLAGHPTFLEVLERVREATLGAFAHQEVPFEKLLKELQPERDPSRTPLFQVFFNMLELPPVSGRIGLLGLEAETLAPGRLRSKFDLTIYVSRRTDGISLRLVYNPDLFDRQRMDELMAQYETLLAQVAEDPEARVERLSLVTEGARRVLPAPALELDAGWRGTVHEVFAGVAAAEPGRPAVIDSHGVLSYGELAAQIDVLAVELAAAGVGRGDLVAIYGHRSAALVWAVLGVLRSGGAFLILDPAHPPARQLEILRHAAPAAWIELAGHPPPESLGVALEVPGGRRLSLPPRVEWPGWRRRVSPPAVRLGADDLACVAFTSGSTGGPKGICGRHGSLSHFLPWQVEAFGFGPEDRFSMLSGLAHDPLQRDIFTPLQAGAAVVIPDPDQILQPGALASWMAEARISVAHLTPGLGQVLAETGGHAVELPALRWAFLVGDVLTRRLVAKLEDLAPALSCVNYYGATETQRAVGYHWVAAGESRRPRAAEVLPLGRGIPDVQLLVLGRSGSLAGVGEVGEIAVASPHVALGYLADPALTAERFTPDPRGVAGRVYLTGDLGRYRPDGEVDFVRRADQQIKLRGYRIEPAEIESALGRHPAVRAAAVGLMDDASGEEVLVAWWTAPRGAKARAGELRALAAEHLPAAMVPAVYVPLDELPLTPTGKLDRSELRQLAVPALARRRQELRQAAPRDAYQLQLLSLWEQVLRRNPIGVRDNFFDLGGHSLLAIRLFALIEQSFGQALPISSLFQAPTVEQLAHVLRREGYHSRFSSVVPIHPWGDRPPLFFVHGITGDPFIYRNLAQHLGDDQPLYGLLARGLDGQAPPFVGMEEMAAHYLREIRQVQPRGPYFLGGFCFGGVAASEIGRQLTAIGERVALVATFDGHAAISRSLPRPVVRRYQRSQLRRQAERHLEISRSLPPIKRFGYLGARAVKLLVGIGLGWWRRQRLFRAPGSRLPVPADVVEANRVASRTYAPDFYPGRVTVFRSVESLGEIFLDPELGWQVLARDGADLHEIPGLHHTMFDEPNVRVLAAELRRCLDAASEAFTDAPDDQD